MKSLSLSIDQSLTLYDELTKEDLDNAIAEHKGPSPYMVNTPFPGEFKWKMMSNEYSDGVFTRELLFTFSWKDDDEILKYFKEMEGEEYDDINDIQWYPHRLLGDYEGIGISNGDDWNMHDYENSVMEIREEGSSNSFGL